MSILLIDRTEKAKRIRYLCGEGAECNVCSSAESDYFGREMFYCRRWHAIFLLFPEDVRYLLRLRDELM